LRTSDNDVVIDDGHTADLLNSYFSSVCTTDDGNMPPVSHVMPESVSQDTVDFSPTKVLAAIKKLKPIESGGFDGFPPLLFKQLAPALTIPLYRASGRMLLSRQYMKMVMHWMSPTTDLYL
jgi:hypothetical protein